MLWIRPGVQRSVLLICLIQDELIWGLEQFDFYQGDPGGDIDRVFSIFGLENCFCFKSLGSLAGYERWLLFLPGLTICYLFSIFCRDKFVMNRTTRDYTRHQIGPWGFKPRQSCKEWMDILVLFTDIEHLGA